MISTALTIISSLFMQQARPESELLVSEYQNKLAAGMDQAQARSWYTKELGAVWQKYQCNPMKSFVTLAVNGTLFISFFLALRGLSDAKVSKKPAISLMNYTPICLLCA